jgi:hypothetical protein
MSQRKREKAWTEFVGWCKARGLRALPAHPWTVAAYARWCEARHLYPHILGRMRAIARAHLLACLGAPDRHPVVTRTLRTIEARHRTRDTHSTLFPADEVVAATLPLRPRVAPDPPARKRTLRLLPRLVSHRPGGGS